MDRVFVGCKVSMIFNKMSVLGVNQRANQVSVNESQFLFNVIIIHKLFMLNKLMLLWTNLILIGIKNKIIWIKTLTIN